MKRYFMFLIIPIFAVMLLCGCRETKANISQVQEAFSDMKTAMIVEGENNFFANEQNPNAIYIKYSSQVKDAINTEDASNPVQKRYRALYYQQAILNNIYDFYNNYEEEFYRIAPSKDIDEKEIGSLYDDVIELRDTLKSFSHHYDTFVAATKSPSDVMAFNITSYSFHLNGVIDKSFDFIYRFYDMYVEYCVEDFSIYNEHNLNLFVDKAYLDIGYIVYLENIKSFNYSVGDNGICDLSSVVENGSEYNILNLLDSKKSLASSILENVGKLSTEGTDATNKLDLFVYARDVYNQRINTYLNTFSSVDMYQVNQYRFNLNGNVNYESYLMSLSTSDRATLVMLDNFIEDNFKLYVSKLIKIVE